MVDVEVMRLRRLRAMALTTRARTGAFKQGHSEASATQQLLCDTLICSWRLAGVASGRLRGHPYAPYQRDHGRASVVWDAIGARAFSMYAALRRRPHHAIFIQLQSLASELDDTRAVTWDSDLSDTLGRCQQQLRKLMRAWKAAARHEVNVHGPLESHRRALPTAHRLDRSVAAIDWPYLAI